MAETPKVVGPLYVRRQGYMFCVEDAGQRGAVLAVEFSPDEAVARARELAPQQDDVSVDLREE